MAIGPDRVQALKYENAAKGGDAADDTLGIPMEISPQEDVLETAGVYLQDALNRDENVYIDRDGDDLRFRDVNNPTPVPLSDVLKDKITATYLVGSAGAGDTADGVDFLDTGDGQAIVDALTAAAANAGRVYIRSGTYDFTTGSAGSSLPITGLSGCVISGEGKSSHIILDSLNRSLISSGVGLLVENLKFTTSSPQVGATGTGVISLGFSEVRNCEFEGFGAASAESLLYAIQINFGTTVIQGCTFTDVSSGTGDGWAIGASTNRSFCTIARNTMSGGKGFVRNLTQSSVIFNNLSQTSGASTGSINGTNELIVVNNKILPFGTTTPQIVIAGTRNVVSGNIISGIFNATTYGVQTSASASVISNNVFQNTFFTNGDGIRIQSGTGNIITGNRLFGFANPINNVTSSNTNNLIRGNFVPANSSGSPVRTLTVGTGQLVRPSDELLLLDSTSGNVQVALPLANSVPPGFRLSGRRINNFIVNRVTFIRQSTNLIDGATTYTFSTVTTKAVVSFISDGVSNWYVET